MYVYVIFQNNFTTLSCTQHTYTHTHTLGLKRRFKFTLLIKCTEDSKLQYKIGFHIYAYLAQAFHLSDRCLANLQYTAKKVATCSLRFTT